MRRIFSCMTALVAVTLVGCGRTDAVSLSIARAVQSGPGTRLVLAEDAAFAYTPDADVDRISDIPGAAARAFDIRQNDGIDALLFISRQKVVASVAHERRGADFGPEVVGRCYAREEFSGRLARQLQSSSNRSLVFHR